MLFLLIACAAGVYLWQHAPALLMLLAAGGLLWYVVIPLCVIIVCSIVLLVGWSLIWSHDLLSWLANALPDWRIFRASHPPASAPESHPPLVARNDLVAIPLLLGLALVVIVMSMPR